MQIKNIYVFVELGSVASLESLICKESSFITKGYEIQIEKGEATGIKIIPVSEEQGQITSSFFEREREVQLNVKTEIALNFTLPKKFQML